MQWSRAWDMSWTSKGCLEIRKSYAQTRRDVYVKRSKKNRPLKPTKFILMNTVGVRNPDLEEKRAWYERGLLFLLRHMLPPHRDNETAAAHLLRHVTKENEHIEWCSVRPDSLVNAEISAYDIEESPTTGLFAGRPTARSNVAHFMMELIENAELWKTWKFRMPVIMNSRNVG